MRRTRYSGRDRDSPRRTRERLQQPAGSGFYEILPASKQEVTIGKAEEFLASLLDEDEDDRGYDRFASV